MCLFLESVVPSPQLSVCKSKKMKSERRRERDVSCGRGLSDCQLDKTLQATSDPLGVHIRERQK